MPKSRLLGAVGIVAVVGGVLAAQTPASPAFEVASVKPNRSDNSTASMGFQPGGRFAAENMWLNNLIAVAFGTSGHPLRNSQIVGGPSWLGSDRFDIAAKVGGDLPADVQSLTKQMPAILRALLEDRFKLKTHMETREQLIYALVKARTDGRLGPGLLTSAIDCVALERQRAENPATGAPVPPGSSPCTWKIGSGRFSATGDPISDLASMLSSAVAGVVVDQTGLAGTYDIQLRWMPSGRLTAAVPDATSVPDAPDIFTAVQEQLGLKLDSTKGPVDVLVIDHVERPTED
jgi:uncharacterized protein (TIGR03435 family)